jgi:hypothetical protein
MAKKNARTFNKIQKGIMPKRRRKDDKKIAKVTMPYLPFKDKLTDEVVAESKMLKNIKMRIQVKNEVEKETMLEVLRANFLIHDVGNVFERIEGSKTIRFFNVFLSKKT